MNKPVPPERSTQVTKKRNLSMQKLSSIESGLFGFQHWLTYKITTLNRFLHKIPHLLML